MKGNKVQCADIWLLKSHPSTGREFYGVRPAVIIQGKFLQKNEGLATVMLMSSYKGKKWTHDILVQPDACNRLKDATLIKVQHIKSFDTSRFIHKIGELDAATMGHIKQYLALHFSL